MNFVLGVKCTRENETICNDGNNLYIYDWNIILFKESNYDWKRGSGLRKYEDKSGQETEEPRNGMDR